MHSLTAIVFDFDGVVADCRRSVLLPGAAKFIREAAQVVPLAIASGAMTLEIDDLLRAHALRGEFVALIGVDQVLRSKPAPDPFLEAVQRMRAAGHQVESERTVAIDDSVSGLVAARSAQLRCVGVGTAARAAQLQPHAELVVSSLEALTLDMLDTLVRSPYARAANAR